MAFFGGSVGIIYRQFSVTIVSAMALSALVALTLTPTLCAHLLKPGHLKRAILHLFQPRRRRQPEPLPRHTPADNRSPAPLVLLALTLTLLMLWQYQKLASGFRPKRIRAR